MGNPRVAGVEHLAMVNDMNEARMRTEEQVREVLPGR